MRPEDWQRCEGEYGAGRVRVDWTDSVDRSQSYLPMASPFVTKLTALAARAHSEGPFDVIYSHYMEPYGIAGYLAARMTGAPHVVRMAGSDAGRLWLHPQFEPLYDYVLRSADIVVAAGAVAERAVARGVDRARIASAESVAIPEQLFKPTGPIIDIASVGREIDQDLDLRDLLWGEFRADRPYFGVFGKLGDRKGSFALLAAMHRLKQAGLDIGLVALAHGHPDIEKKFRNEVQRLDLADRVLQIPFLPHWRVPEFLRGCLAVCCLEQDFPITFHTPIIPLEALLCGKCLVASSEIIRKLPDYERLPSGYGCVAIEDVNDVAGLSAWLAAIVIDPGPTAAVGARGCAFARNLQSDFAFPNRLEHLLEAAASGQRASIACDPADGVMETDENPRFCLTQMAAAEIAPKTGENNRPRSQRINRSDACARGAGGYRP